MRIPSGYVPQSYRLNKTDTVLPGQLLKPGMVVLLLDGRKRGNPLKRARNTHTQAWLDVKARWCRIESITRAAPRSETISFTGLYADGTSLSRQTTTLTSWIVKSASIKE